MTLDDFFTLTEMKDGLTALARVEELVSMMQKEKDSVVKNVGEAARQWSTVASTLAATESKDSLDHFIRLDGLYFLDQWLQEALKCGNDARDLSVEESISALLGALKKLPIEYDMSVSSGIKVTIRNLFGHKSIRVQEGAKALFDSWNQGKENDSDHRDVEKDDGSKGVVKPANATLTVESGYPGDSVVEAIAKEDSHVIKPAERELQQSRSLDVSQLESVKGVKIPISSNRDVSDTAALSEVVDKDGFGRHTQDQSMTTSCQEKFSIIREESSTHPAERTSSVGICSSPVTMESSAKPGPLDPLPELKDFTNDATERPMMKCSRDKFGNKEICSVSISSVREQVFSADPANSQQSVMEPAVPNDVEAKESELCPKKTMPAGFDSDSNTLASELNSSKAVDCWVPKYSRSKVDKTTDQAGVLYTSQELTINGCILRKPEDSESSFPMEEDIGAVNDAKELASESILKVVAGVDSAISGDVSNPRMEMKVFDKIDTRRVDMELDFVVEDALEVARQVAKEVEQAVVDYREPLCSSSPEKNSEAGVVQPESPDSINGKQDRPLAGPDNEMPTGQNLLCGSPSSKGEELLMDPMSMDKAEDFVQDQDSSQVIGAAVQESADDTKMGVRDFDLNEVVHLEEMDQPRVSVSVPITVVSASRAAAPEFPVAPPHFEGELGWKGSAATSAFRPASNRRISDGEKVLSVDGSGYSSKQRQDCLNIDLNVAGGNGDGGTDLMLAAKQIPVSSGLTSGECSMEVSSRRGDKLKLDLNCTGDNEDAPPSSDWRMESRLHFNHRNGFRSPSPTSSSSSKHPSMKNIDLNDNPSLLDSYDQRPDPGKSSSSSSQDRNAYGGGFQLDDPVISIMGTRVAVTRKESVPQTWSFLPDRQVGESSVVANFAKSVGGVGEHHPAMAYYPSPPPGLSMGPSMSLSPAMYGSACVPYMVDSRGVPVASQIVGSQVTVPSFFRPPFPMSMTVPPSGFNVAGPKLPNLDLNSGSTVSESESREAGGWRQLFNPGQAVMTEEQMRSMKRKEPDVGWDLHQPDIYKQKSPRR